VPECHAPGQSAPHPAACIGEGASRLTRRQAHHGRKRAWPGRAARLPGFPCAAACGAGADARACHTAMYRPGSGPDSEHVAEYPGAPTLGVLPLLHDFPDPGRSHRFPCSSPPLGHIGVEVPRGTSPGFGGCLRARPRHRARAPLDPARAMRSHRRGEDVVTITAIQPRSTNSARAMMHSARDLQTRLRIDLAIQIGSAIEPVPHAHAQVTADRRLGAGPGLL
jgi:hypothetical protein